MLKEFKRGQIWIANMIDGVGSEQKGKSRPVVILQNDIGNKYAPTITILPLTSQNKKWMPTHVTLHKTTCLISTSIVLAEQITTISVERFKNYIGNVNEVEMLEIENAVSIHLSMHLNKNKICV